MIPTDIRVKVHGIGNTLPFQRFWVFSDPKIKILTFILLCIFLQETDKAAYLVRQYIHFNLYDRIR